MNKAIEDKIELISETILESENIYIVSHVNPDGDNLGSCLSLALALKKIKKEVFILKVDETPLDFLFLPGIDMIRDYKDGEDIDLLIALDSSDLGRLGKNKKLLDIANTTINIDHHISNTNFADINLVDSKASASGELIYDILRQMDIDIDKDIATCIYTAISTDTGSFKYDNTSSKTHKITAKLIEYGADIKSVNINIYQNKSLARTKLLIKALNNMNMYFDNQVAIVKVSKNMLEKTGSTMEDTEGIVEFIRDIGPVEIAILIKENKDDEVKVSMRSKRFVDVAKITEAFNGGGHKMAAGCTIKKPIDQAEKLLINEIKKVL